MNLLPASVIGNGPTISIATRENGSDITGNGISGATGGFAPFANL